MKKLKLSVIRTDGGTQARVRMCQDTVAEYASKMSDGVVMPPIVVFFDKKEYWLADGFHRYFAAKSNGDLEIECEVQDGTVEDAMLYSFSANGGRGLSMTPEDNFSIVSRMLAHPKWKSWTDSAIAKHIHVSNSTVGRIRRKLEESGKVEKKTEKKYTDKHGNEATMKVGNIGKTKKTAEKDLPKAPEPESSGDLIQELTDTISALSEENTLLKDKIAIEQWDASEIEKMDAADTIKELREQVRVLEIENKSLKENRDMYMNRNAELTRTVKSLQAKLNKLEN
jgi:ParB-like chromosome segregation protein Spo0J